MKNAILKWIPLLVLLVPMQSWAAPITYDIVFTASQGNAPTAAEFTYDADTLTLTGLSITWEGTFDNFFFKGSLCGAGDAGAFNLLLMACPQATLFEWEAGDFGAAAGYFILYAGVEGAGRSVELWGDRTELSDNAFASGRAWVSTPRATSVPEPGTLALLGLGLAGLGFTRRRRKTTQV